jgi:large subunit ribosomal protein L22
MKTIAKAKYLKISPQKLRSVADLIRGKNINNAFSILMVTKKKGCLFIKNLLKNAVNNIQQKDSMDNLDIDKLYVEEIYVDGGPVAKRWMPRAMGRATKIRKRTSHLTLCLVEKNIGKNTSKGRKK